MGRKTDQHDTITLRTRFRQLRWLAIIVPLLFLIAYSYLLRGPVQELVHSPAGFGLLIGILGILVGIFATSIFGLFEQQHATILRKNQELMRLNKHLQGLHAAALAVASERGLPTVLQRVVDITRSLFKARYAALMTVNRDGDVVDFFASGMDPATNSQPGFGPSVRGLLGNIMRSTGTIRVDDIRHHPAFQGFPNGHPHMQQLLGVPLTYQSRTLGGLFLADHESGEPFRRQDEQMLETFALQVAIAIESARLYREVQVLATETERQRIAHEMHDGTAQILAYVNAKAQAIHQFLSWDQVAEAQRHLDQLAEAVRGVYADVREGILGLQAQLSPDEKLADLLREYLQEYREQTNLETRFHVDLPDEDTGLDSLQEIQVLRIVQEALTNARRHAGTHAVDVELIRNAHGFRAQIRDYGQGFDPGRIRRPGRPCFGLQTMQERAESIGGSLTVDSSPGHGTCIELMLPLPATGKVVDTHELSAG